MDKLTYDAPSSMTDGQDQSSVRFVAHLVTDSNHTEESIKKVSLVPKRGDRCPYLKGMFTQSVEYSKITPNYWQLQIDYSNWQAVVDSEEAEYPWRRRPDIRYTPDPVQIIATRYYENDEAKKAEKPILNSSGDLFDNPPTVARMRKRIEITWWVRDFRDALIDQYWNTLNQTAMTFDARSYQPKTLWLSYLNKNPFWSSRGVECVKMDAEILFDPEGFNYQAIQCGFNAIDPVAKKKAPVRLDQKTGKYTFDPGVGSPITDPVLLNKDGGLLTMTAADMPKATPVYTDMRYLPLADWKGLSIPSLKSNPKRFMA